MSTEISTTRFWDSSINNLPEELPDMMADVERSETALSTSCLIVCRIWIPAAPDCLKNGD